MPTRPYGLGGGRTRAVADARTATVRAPTSGASVSVTGALAVPSRRTATVTAFSGRRAAAKTGVWASSQLPTRTSAGARTRGLPSDGLSGGDGRGGGDGGGRGDGRVGRRGQLGRGGPGGQVGRPLHLAPGQLGVAVVDRQRGDGQQQRHHQQAVDQDHAAAAGSSGSHLAPPQETTFHAPAAARPARHGPEPARGPGR